MSQTTYPTEIPTAFAGLIYDLASAAYIRSGRNASGGDLPFGIGVKQKSAPTQDEDFDVPSAAGDVLRGVLVHFQGQNPLPPSSSVGGSGGTSLQGSGNSILASDRASVMRKGRVYVLPEQTVTVADPVYVRIATSANDPTKTQKGAFRKDADGVAAVVTVTPTAANAEIYELEVVCQLAAGGTKRFHFESQGDGTATATEICNDFRTAMAADAEFTALVVASGTATLILTGQVAGQTIVANNVGDGVLAIVATTPAAPTAVLVKGACWDIRGTTAIPAVLNFDMNAAAS